MKNLRLTMFLAVVAAIGLSQPAVAQVELHGISFLKGAISPVEVGDPYEAEFLIWNNVDTAGDTLHVTALVDTVLASGGDVISANLLPLLAWTLEGGAYFEAPDHLVLPPGGKAYSAAYSHYTTVAGDFALPGHALVDTAVLTWHDVCDGTGSNCNQLERQSNTVSQATVTAPLPCINVTKTVDCDVAMVGKELTYTIEIENCGPNPLTLVSVIDSLLGDITAAATANCGSLGVGETCSFTVNYTIQADDPDPLPNTVDVTYVDEFQQEASESDDAEVDIIHPNFTVTKACTSQPISGQTATFEVVIQNTGDVALEFTTDEAAMSDVPEPFALSAGGTINLTITKPAAGSNVNNEITVTANVSNTLDCPIQDLVKTSNLATCYALPTINVTKDASCDVAKPGNEITYTITIENQGANPLTLVSVIDSLLGDITAQAQAAACNPLAAGATCSFDVARTVLPGDPDTLNNMVTATYIDAQQQQATDSDTAEVEVVHPDFTVTKTCDVDPIPAEATNVTFTVTIQNTGDVDLSFTTDEAAQSSLAEPFTVSAGNTQNLTITLPYAGSDVTNTITVTAVVLFEVDPDCPIPPIVKMAGDTCEAPVTGITRTIGFWGEHTDFTRCIFLKAGSSIDLGWRVVTTDAELFGIFQANPAKQSNGAKRSALCQAQVKASKQALAALLNTWLEGGKSLPDGVTPQSIADTLEFGTVKQINNLQKKLDWYNNSGVDEFGEELPLSPNEPCVQGNATPDQSKAIADITFADCD